MNAPERPRSPDAVRTGDETIVPVVAERAEVSVQERATGQVRVAIRTGTVERTLEETLETTTADIVRVPIDRELAFDEIMPVTRVEDGVTIVPVVEERLVVEKRLVLVEEIRIERSIAVEDVSVPVSLRQQHVDIDRTTED